MKVTKMNFQASKGFSLLELLVAIAIISTATIGGLNLISTNTESYAFIKRATSATQIGSDVMEDLLNKGTDHSALQPGTYSALYDADGKSVTSDPFYTVTWTITPDTPRAGLIRIQLQTAWAANNLERKTRLESYRRVQ